MLNINYGIPVMSTISGFPVVEVYLILYDITPPALWIIVGLPHIFINPIAWVSAPAGVLYPLTFSNYKNII